MRTKHIGFFSVLLAFVLITGLLGGCAESDPAAVWQNSMHFHPTAAELKTIPTAAQTPNAVTEENGVTLTVLQTVADAYIVYTLFRVDVPDGAVFHGNVGDTGAELKIPRAPDANGGTSSATSFLQLLAQEGSSLTYLLTAYAFPETPLQNGSATLTFSYSDTWSSTETLPGSIAVSWDFAYEAAVRTQTFSGRYTIAGKDVGSIAVTVTPLSFLISLEDCAARVNLYSKAEICLQFKDGQRIVIGAQPLDGIKSGISGDGSETVYFRFDRVVDPSAVESITVDGVELVMA